MTTIVAHVVGTGVSSGGTTRLTTAPSSGDVLYALLNSGRVPPRYISTISGVGGTWQRIATSPTSGGDLWVNTSPTVGATGTAADVTWTGSGADTGLGHIELILVSGITDPTKASVFEISATSVTSQTGPASMAIGGQLVLTRTFILDSSATTTGTYPAGSTPLPAADWSTSFGSGGTSRQIGRGNRTPTETSPTEHRIDTTATVATSIRSYTFVVGADSSAATSPVTVVETVQVESLASGTTVAATLTTTPVAGDVIVAAVRSTGALTTGVAGGGATWTAGTGGTTNKQNFWIGTSPTSGGPVTATLASSSVNKGITLYLVRGLTSTTFTGGINASGTSLGTSHYGGFGQIVLSVFATGSTTGGNFPTTTGMIPTPNGAWTSIGGTNTYYGNAYAIPNGEPVAHRIDNDSSQTARQITTMTLGTYTSVTTVAGGQASSTNTALTGAVTVGARVVGGQATEADSALAGAVSTVAATTVNGGQASETDSALTGSRTVGSVVTGGQATTTNTALAGTTTVLFNDIYSPAVLTDSPQGYWKLNESTGATTMADSSGNSRNGTYSGTPTFGQPGLIAGETDTSTAFYNGSASGTATITDAAWMDSSDISLELLWKTPAPGQGNAITLIKRFDSSGRNWMLGTAWSGSVLSLVWYIRLNTNTTVSISTPVSLSTAYHVVVTHDQTTARIYLNGVEAVNGALGARTVNVTSDIIIGEWYGPMEKVAFYNTLLSPTRVAAHYSAFSGAPAPSTVVGGQATEADSAPTGTTIAPVVYVGSRATETDSVLTGVVVGGTTIVAGGKANENDYALNGGLPSSVTVVGGKALETDVARPGLLGTPPTGGAYSSVIVFDDLSDSFFGATTQNLTTVYQNSTVNMLVFDSDRIVRDLTNDSDEHFIVFDSPQPVLQAQEGDQEFLLVDDPKELRVQAETGVEVLVITGSGPPPRPNVVLLEAGWDVPGDTPPNTIIFEKGVGLVGWWDGISIQTF